MLCRLTLLASWRGSIGKLARLTNQPGKALLSVKSHSSIYRSSEKSRGEVSRARRFLFDHVCRALGKIGDRHPALNFWGYTARHDKDDPLCRCAHFTRAPSLRSVCPPALECADSVRGLHNHLRASILIKCPPTRSYVRSKLARRTVALHAGCVGKASVAWLSSNTKIGRVSLGP